jgi:phytoene dehydrogenase-like protein
LKRIEQHGGALQLNTHVKEIVVREGKGVAVRLDNGDDIPAAKAILADVGAPALYFRMLPEACVTGWVRQSMRRFQYGWGTFKMDWALAAPAPWSSEEARQAAVVHAGDSIDDLIQFTNEVRSGVLPGNPYHVIGQQSLLDPSRAPAGGHTLWAYSRVPSTLTGGWVSHKEAFADRIEMRIERLAPGFRELIRGRAIFAPDDLERMNENLVGGDLGGDSAHFSHLLFWRPVFPYFRHRTPVRGVYLCSASANPGAGVHGACGFNAANMALVDCQ